MSQYADLLGVMKRHRDKHNLSELEIGELFSDVLGALEWEPSEDDRLPGDDVYETLGWEEYERQLISCLGKIITEQGD